VRLPPEIWSAIVTRGSRLCAGCGDRHHWRTAPSNGCVLAGGAASVTGEPPRRRRRQRADRERVRSLTAAVEPTVRDVVAGGPTSTVPDAVRARAHGLVPRSSRDADMRA